jgi:hypothetical protein
LTVLSGGTIRRRYRDHVSPVSTVGNQAFQGTDRDHCSELIVLRSGTNALHRVTPIQGGTPRINSVLTYGERPDMKLNELTQRLCYGRTA